MFGGDPRDVLAFCPKEELVKLKGSLKDNNKNCNMCVINKSVRNYNNDDFARPVCCDIDVDNSESDISVSNNSSESDDSNDSLDAEDEYIYSNGIQCDICKDCYETYPETNELKEGLIFYSMIYEHSHYYPCFPDTENILTDRHDFDFKSINAHEIQYKGCKYLDSFASYNTMLECMDMFGLSFNECLTHFIESVENGKRESNLSTLGFGKGFPNAPLVIYKFLEKFIRYTVVNRMHSRPRTPLAFPEKEEANSSWYNYDDEVKKYYYEVEKLKKLEEYPNNYKICWRETWPLQDIHLVNFMYENCFFQDEYEYVHDYFLGKFNYKTSINAETKDILFKFLQKYNNVNVEPNKEDYKYTSIDSRSYNEGKWTCTYKTHYIGDEYGGLDRNYRCAQNENVFLHAIYKFAQSINIKDDIYKYLKQKYNLPNDILNHIDLMY